MDEDHKEIGLTFSEIKDGMSKEQLKKKIEDKDTKDWKEELNNKTSLKIYREWKRTIKEETFYDNRPSSVVLFKCRTNNLELNDRNKFMNQDTRCKLCEETNEDLAHYLLHCPAYNEIRSKIPEFQQPYIENENELIGKYLFTSKNIKKVKDNMYKFWKIRTKKLKEKDSE